MKLVKILYEEPYVEALILAYLVYFCACLYVYLFFNDGVLCIYFIFLLSVGVLHIFECVYMHIYLNTHVYVLPMVDILH